MKLTTELQTPRGVEGPSALGWTPNELAHQDATLGKGHTTAPGEQALQTPYSECSEPERQAAATGDSSIPRVFWTLGRPPLEFQ